MKVLVAKSAGFCGGVKRAVELTKQGIPNKKYVLGSLVHNKEVVSELKNMGIAFSDRPMFDYDEVVISAHGTTSFLYDSIKNQKITDATCLNVKKIIDIAKKIDENSLLIMVGDSNHSEVKNVISFAKNAVVLPRDRFDISVISKIVMPTEVETSHQERNSERSLNAVSGITQSFERKKFDNYYLVYQTTLEDEVANLYFEELKKVLGNKLTAFDTRCSSVKRRILESVDIAKQVQLMVVIGDKTSANCNTIFNECKKYNANTIFVENENDLPKIDFEIVGLTAGASVSLETIEKVKNKLEKC